MLKLKFVNGHEHEYSVATMNGKSYIKDMMRSVLEVVFPSDADIAEILSELTEENCGTITLINTETTVEHTYEGYTFIHMAGFYDGEIKVVFCTNNISEQVLNIITEGE